MLGFLSTLFAPRNKKKKSHSSGSALAKRLTSLKGRGLRMEPLEERQLLSLSPTVGSLTTPVDWVKQGAAPLVVTADSVVDLDGIVSKVDFYFDTNSNGTLDVADTLIGTDTDGTNGWTTSYAPSGLATGTYNLLAKITDNDNLASNVVTKSLSIFASDVTVITDLAGLQAVSANPAGKFALANDIDASETATWNGGLGFSPIGTFSGSFDGRGHVIRNLRINRPTVNYVALFSNLASTGQISNLGLENVQIDGQLFSAGLAGCNAGGTISNCYVTGTVTGRADSNGNGYIGGLTGGNFGAISDSHVVANVTMLGNGSGVGGLTGYFITYNNFNASISNCYAAGSVTGYNNVGGLAGYVQSQTNNTIFIDNSYSTANVISSSANAGGFTGAVLILTSIPTIKDCFSTGNVRGNTAVGAFVGNISGTPIFTNNYYNSGATFNCSSGTVNYGNATSTTLNALGSATHNVYTRSGETWAFSGATPKWIMAGLPHLAAESNQPCHFQDPDVQDAVREALGLNTGQIPTLGQVMTLTTLTLDSNKIQSLAGLETAVNLTSLTIVPADSSLAAMRLNLTPLGFLTNLETLSLQHCGLLDGDLAPIANLTNLESLDLRYNNLRSVPQSVAGLSSYKLTQLYLYGNVLEANDPTQGLVGRWTFDSVSGSLAADSAAPVNELGTAWVAGKTGNALNFNAAYSANVAINNVGVNTAAGGYNTVSFWMKWDGTNLGMPIYFASGYDLFLSGGYFGFNTNVGDNYGMPSAGLINQWVHVGAVFANGQVSKCQLYINGQQQVLQNVGAASQAISLSGSLVLGGTGNAQYPYPFSGAMDDVRIYNRLLEPTEISALANLGEVTTGLAGKWQFDQTAGVVAPDSSGAGHNGTLNNFPSNATTPVAWQEGKIGNAINFDTVYRENVVINNVGVSTAAGEYNTVAFWMKWNGGVNQMPICWGNVGPREHGYDLFINGNYLGFNTYQGDVTGVAVSPTWIGQWVHVTAVFYNGTFVNTNQVVANTVKIYINGQLQTLEFHPYSPTQTTASGTATSKLIVGNIDSADVPTSPYTFNGVVDDLRVYNRSLDSTEISSLVNLGEVTSGLVGKWQFDETSGSAATDTSGYGHNGTLSNFPNVNTAALPRDGVLRTGGDPRPAWIEGKIGNALNLYANSEQYISMSNVGVNLTAGGYNTVSFWMKRPAAAQYSMPFCWSGSSYALYMNANDFGFCTFNGDIHGIPVSAIPAEQWVHIAAVFANGTITNGKIYINGIEQSLSQRLSGTPLSRNASQSPKFGMGDGGFAYQGGLDDLRIYSSQLNATDIATLAGLGTIATNPVGWWKLDSASGNTTNDETSYAHHGTLNNFYNLTVAPVAWQEGISGNALNFSAPYSQNVSMTNVGVNTTAGGYNTVAFWMKWDGTDLGMPILFDSGYDLFLRNYGSTQTFGFNTNHSDIFGISGSSVINLINQWVHVTAIFVNNNIESSQLFINGQQQTLTRLADVPNTTMTVSGSLHLAGPPGYTFGGMLDDVRVFNRALTAEEVSTVANSGYVASGLVGSWQLDQTTGSVAPDSSGYGHHGTLNFSNLVTSAWQEGRTGNAVNFVASSNQYISMSSVGANTSGGGYNTVTFWMKRPSAGQYAMPFTWGGASWSLYMNPNDFGFCTYNGDIYGIALSEVPADQWVHIAAVFRNAYGAQYGRLYVNGVAKSMTQRVGTTLTRYASQSPKFGMGDGGFAFQGGLDDLRIYNGNLGATDIATLYSLGTITTNPVGWWKLNSASGTVAYDATSYAHNGTLYNFGDVPSSLAVATTGARGSALQLDPSNGKNQYATFNSVAINSSAGGKNTVAFWMKLDAGVNGVVPFSWEAAGGSRGYNLLLKDNKFGFNTTSSEDMVYTTVPSDWYGNWVNVTAVFYNGTPSTSNCKLYINGKQVSLTATGTAVSKTATSTAYAGCCKASAQTCINYFKGALDDLRIYNRELMADEVAVLATSGQAVQVDMSNLAGKPVNVDLIPEDPNNAKTIADLAKALYYNPLKMYEWVLNNIKYVPYPGAMKGSLATLQTKEGNDWDTATLLQDLFKTANITLNYANAYVRQDQEDVVRWLGAKNVAGAYNILFQSGLEPVLYRLVGGVPTEITNPAADWPDTAFISFNHTYLHRAAGGGLPEMYLDPSWKFKDYQPGIPGLATNVPFDASREATYLSTLRKEPTYEFYENEVRNYLAQNNATSTIADVVYDGPIHPQAITAIPSSFPFFDRYGLNENASLSYFESYRHQLRISVNLPQPGRYITSDTYNGTTTPIALAGTPGLFTSAMVGGPLIVETSDWRRAFTIDTVSNGNQLTVKGDAFFTGSASFYLPGLSYLGYSTDLALKKITIGNTDAGELPTFYADGYIDGTTSIQQASTMAVPSSDPRYFVVLERTHGNGATSFPEPEENTCIFERGAGVFSAVGMDVGQFSEASLAAVRSDLNDAELTRANGGSPLANKLIGGLLHLSLATYYKEFRDAKREIAGLTGAVDVHWAIGVGTSTSNVDDISELINANDNTYQKNVQFPYLPSSVGFDLPQNIVSGIANGGDTSQIFNRNRLLGDTMSSMEATVLEELTNMPGVSSMKIFQQAKQDASDAFTTFYHDTGVTLDEIRNFLDSSIPDVAPQYRRTTYARGILGFLENDYDVDVHKKEVLIGDDPNDNNKWKGIAYACHFAENTYGFTSSYIIHGGVGGQLDAPHGGFGIWPAQTVIPAKDSYSNLYSTDPINTVNGNVTHDETDLSIPNLGTPLDFARHYDSSTTVPWGSKVWSDRGMGEGWSFSYSDKLTGSYDAAGKLVRSGDLSKTWFTGTGIQHTYAYAGGAYTIPPTVFGTLSDNGVNLGYTWKDSQGNETNFDDYGKLVSIKDRYGNGITVIYNGSGQIATVQDAKDVNRKLSFTYTGNHITKITDFGNRAWTYEYDVKGRLMRVRAPSDRNTSPVIVQYDYYDDDSNPATPDGWLLAGLLKTVATPDGNVTRYTYYANRRGFKAIDGKGNEQSLTYNLYRKRTEFINELGNAVYTTYDDKGNPLNVVSGDKTTMATQWDPATGLKMTSQDAYGQTTSYYYDEKGSLRYVSDPLGNVTVNSYTDDIYHNISEVAQYYHPENTSALSLGSLTAYQPFSGGSYQTLSGNMGVSLTGNIARCLVGGYSINANTILEFDFSSTEQGDIHAIGFDTNDLYETGDPEHFVQLYGTDTLSAMKKDFLSYASAVGSTKHFVIPIGSLIANGYYTRLVFLNYTDGAHGQSVFSNIKFFDATRLIGTAYTYSTADGGKSLVSVARDPAGLNEVTTYQNYDTRGLPESMITPKGGTTPDLNDYKTTYTYNAAGQVLTQTVRVSSNAQDNITLRYHYDALGRMDYSIDGNGNLTNYAADLLGRRLTETLPDPDGNGPLARLRTTNTYDAMGNLVKTMVTTADANTILSEASSVYDSMQRVTQTTNPDGTIRQNIYNTVGNLLSQTDELGRYGQNVYDAQGRAVESVLPDGSVMHTRYDGGGRVVAVTDARGYTVQYAYDKLGRKTSETLPDPDGFGPLNAATTKYYYDIHGNLQYVVDPLGADYSNTAHTTEYEYDALHRQTAVILPDPDGSGRLRTEYYYDTNGNLEYTYNPYTYAWEQYVYDEADRKVQHWVSDPDDSGPLGDTVTRYFYDKNGNLRYTVNPRGTDAKEAAYTTEYVYDAWNRAIQTILPDPDDFSLAGGTNGPAGRPTSISTYNQLGNLASSTDSLGNTTTYAYDRRNRVIKVTDALGASPGDPAHTTTTQYDAVGNVVTVTSALGVATRYEYDSRNRKVKEVLADPDGPGGVAAPVTTYQYDANSNVTAVTDPLGNTSWSQYDGLNRLVKATDALGWIAGDALHTTTTQYDQLGRVWKVIDAQGRTVTYEYDNLGRKIREIQPSFTDSNGQWVTPTTYYGYDLNGNLRYVTDALGTAPNPTTGALDPNHTTYYFYDTLNRPTGTIDALGTDNWSASGIPYYMPGSAAHAISTTYDDLGNVKYVKDQLGRVAFYQYDNLGRKTAETEPYANLASAQTTETISTTGSWTPVATGGYSGNYSTASGPGNTATWQINVPTAGRYYEVFVTYVENTANSAAAPYEVFDGTTGGTLRGSVTVNQKVASSIHPVFQGPDNVKWKSLGFFWVSGTTLSVRLTGASDGLVVADAVKTIEVSPTSYAYNSAGQILGVTDSLNHTTTYVYDKLGRKTTAIEPYANPASAQTSDSATFNGGTTTPVSGGYGGSSTSLSGGGYATWSFSGLDAGQYYEVLVDWVAASANSSNAPYTIYDGTVAGTVAGTATVNQKLAPAIHPVFKDGGVNWQSLGAFWITGNTLTLKLACPTGASVSVDAVKIIKAAPTSTAYDAIGNTLSITDPEHNSTTYAYDRLNRLKSETEAPYGTRSFQYDAGGNLTQETDRDGKVIQYVYDPAGRVVEERWMNGAAAVHTIHTWYDNVGQVRGVTETDTQDAAAGTNYEYRYDSAGNLLQTRIAPSDIAQSTKLFDGDYSLTAAQAIDWDEDGTEENMAAFLVTGIPANKWILIHVHSSQFDPAIFVEKPDGDSSNWLIDTNSGGGTDAYLLFQVGATEGGDWYFFVTSREVTTGSFHFELSILDYPFVTNTQGAFTYAYDAAGQLKRATDINGTVTERDYDVLGRATQIRQSGGGAAQKRADYTYRDDGSLNTVTRYNTVAGNPPPSANEVATSTYSYDGMGRLEGLTYTRGAMTINDYDWDFDAADRITASTATPYQRTAENSTFSYDTQDQLTGALHDYQSDEAYTYDDNGNRLTANGSTYGTGAQNRLLSDGTYNYTYDAEGHRLTKTLGANGATTRYLWDSRGRLVKVTEHATALPTAPATRVIRYYYDSADRLVRRTVDNENNGVLDDVAKYVFDGGDLALQYNTAGSLTHRYLWDAALDQLLADEPVGGQLSWALPDHEGSIRDLVDSSGVILQHVQYDSFGETDAPVACLFGYTGQYRDPLTELQLHGARWYDPAVGRFISEDPSGLTPDSNPYRYCENSPVINVDPSGLWSYGGTGGSGIISNPTTWLNQQLYSPTQSISDWAKNTLQNSSPLAQPSRPTSSYDYSLGNVFTSEYTRSFSDYSYLPPVDYSSYSTGLFSNIYPPFETLDSMRAKALRKTTVATVNAGEVRFYGLDAAYSESLQKGGTVSYDGENYTFHPYINIGAGPGNFANTVDALLTLGGGKAIQVAGKGLWRAAEAFFVPKAFRTIGSTGTSSLMQGTARGVAPVAENVTVKAIGKTIQEGTEVAPSNTARGFTIVEEGLAPRRVNVLPNNPLDTSANWGLRQQHLQKHFFGSGNSALRQIDHAGTPDKWAQHISQLFASPQTGTTANGMIDIVRTFPKADGSGIFKLGVRLAPRADGTFDLITVLTKQ